MLYWSSPSAFMIMPDWVFVCGGGGACMHVCMCVFGLAYVHHGDSCG